MRQQTLFVYTRLGFDTINFGIVFFTYKRWMFSYGITFLPDARGDMLFYSVPTSIRKKSSTVREQPPRISKKNNSKINCESAIGQHFIANPECAKTYTDDNFRIIGQARSSFI